MKTTTMMMLILLMIMTMFPSSKAEVFTSMMKLQQLAKFENALLARMGDHTDSPDIQQFLKSRLQTRNTYDHVSMHPNAGLLLVKAFLQLWRDLFQAVEPMQKAVKLRAELPTTDDVKGCMAALILLQATYNISAREVYSGNFSGYLGPALSVQEAVDIGMHTFDTYQLWYSSSWLEVAREEIDRSLQSQVSQDLIRAKEVVLSLLGRIHNLKGDTKKAHALLREASELTADKPSPPRQFLEKDLSGPRREGDFSHLFRNQMPPSFRHLCRRDTDQTVEKLRPFHVCRYRPSFTAPYVLYKEEVLSYQPYLSLFYDVISDTEITALKTLGNMKLKRSAVTGTDKKTKTSRTRTGQYYWTYASNSEVTDRVTRRISDITWLFVRHKVVNSTNDNSTDTTTATNTNTIDPNTSNTSGYNTTGTGAASGTSEALQVLNYGLGGYYFYHHDEFINENSTKADNLRMATFMLYLSNAEIGGHTIFPAVNISIAPVKGMAVFWYNLSPSGDVDNSTLHSGCPVLKGNKWIANQWIGSHGNLFQRPCGLTVHCDQQDLHLLMDSRRLQPLTPP